MKKEVKFIDGNGVRVSVEIAISDKGVGRYLLDWETLLPVESVAKRLSMSGNCGGLLGQCRDNIKPRTEGQKDLLRLWKEYHLNDVKAGTKSQCDFLESKECQILKEKMENLLVGNNWRDRIESMIS